MSAIVQEVHQVSVSQAEYQYQEAKQVRLRSGQSLQLVFLPTQGTREELLLGAFLSSIANHAVTGNAIFGAALSERAGEMRVPKGSKLISNDSFDGLSGIDLKDGSIRQGDLHAVASWLSKCGGTLHLQARWAVAQAERRGHRAVVVADQKSDLGVIEVY
jgi:high-affinity K+ transport system ATPase subunit B